MDSRREAVRAAPSHSPPTNTPSRQLPQRPEPHLLAPGARDLVGLTQAALARHLRISLVRVNELINGKRGVSAETAWLLAEAFGNSPQFWINLQANYDLATNRPAHHVSKIKRAS